MSRAEARVPEAETQPTPALRTRLRARMGRTRLAGNTRGSATVGLAMAVAAVAGGMALGTGVAKHTVKSDYDLVWLGDSSRGQVVQVDPSGGKANLRLQVAPAGNPLVVQQTDGQLVIHDAKTGKTTSVDLSTLLVGGARLEPEGSGVKVLVDGDHVYVANLAAGTVQAVDPATEKNIGAPWSAGQPLVDVAIDGGHTMWALGKDDDLTSLAWSESSHALRSTSSHKVSGAGAGSVVVGHSKGVTVVGSKGVITRVGNGAEHTMTGPAVEGGMAAAAQNSPDDLVAVAAPGSSAILIIDSSGARVSDVGVLGCDRPGAPMVWNADIYVPCLGASRVLVLDATGRPAAAALQTPPGGDPQLVIGQDRLLISVPGAAYTTVVDSGGTTSRIQIVDPGSIGVEHPTQPAPPPPPAPHPTGSSSSHGNQPGGGSPSGPGAGSGSGSGSGQPSGSGAPSGSSGSSGSSGPGSGSGSGSSSGHPGPEGPPASGTASAEAQPDGTVVVSWKASHDEGATYVVRYAGGDKVATAPAGSTSATVTVLAPGTTAEFEVDAYLGKGGEPIWTALTDSVTSYTAPGAVTGVSVTTSSDGTNATLSIAWTAAAPNGRPVSYTVDVTGATSFTTSDTAATVTVPCASSCSGAVTVTPANEVGSGAAGTQSYSSSAPAPTTTYPAEGEQYATVYSTADGVDNGDGTSSQASVTLSLTAPADWAAAVGVTCTLYADGVSQGVIPCNDAGITQTFYYGDYGSFDHSYYVGATWDGGAANSSAVTATVTVPTPAAPGTGTGVEPTPSLCSGCAIPFSQDERQLTATPASTTSFRRPE